GTGGRPAQRRTRRGGGDQSRGGLQLRRIPLPGGGTGPCCARQRAQGNRPERACLPPAGECAINVVQRAAHIHVGLPALGYLLPIEAVSRRTGAPWSKLAPKDNSAPPILPAAFGSRDSHVENVGGARSEREDPDVDLELLWAGAARASRRCISLPFG